MIHTKMKEKGPKERTCNIVFRGLLKMRLKRVGGERQNIKKVLEWLIVVEFAVSVNNVNV